ncbi:hypothetical protein [Arabiibacter massiliensis]|uniref:hypothetical protein n=1 Tax=Arabiibacter massiliensis TaxID=1870985 RepID=UPI0009BA50A4|nr:hypothetical protein [Arabiibacter massiliensis]
MTGIVENANAIWSFRNSTGLYEQALNQSKREISSIIEEADYQIGFIIAEAIERVDSNASSEEERARAKRFLSGVKQALLEYRAAKEGVLLLIGDVSADDGSQSAQAYLCRLGRALEEYYGLPAFEGADAEPSVSADKVLTKRY